MTRLFGIELPIIQAPMAGVAGERAGDRGVQCRRARLAAVRDAVARSDSQGACRDHRGDVEALQRQLLRSSAAANPIPRAKRRGARCWRRITPSSASIRASIQAGPARVPFNDEAADVLEEFKPPVVSFHFGLPSEALLARVKRWGAKILSSATTRRGSALSRGARRGRGDRPGLRSRRPPRHVPVERCRHAGWDVGADLRRSPRSSAMPVIAAGGIADAMGVTAAHGPSARPARRSAPPTCCAPRRRPARSIARR